MTSMWLRLCAALLFAGSACLWSGSAMAGDIVGVWLTANGESEIEIQPCDNGLCGRIVTTFKPSDGQASPANDVNNPDPALRSRPMLGLTILSGLKPAEDPEAWEGLVYNPRDGKTYAVFLTLKGDVIEVEGCMAYILCDGQEWTRVPASQ